MTLETSRVGSFLVVGLEARTTNVLEMSDEAVIPKLWGRLMGDTLLDLIPERVDDRIVAVYYDYASDKDGAYSYLLGAKVSSAEEIPPGMVSHEVAKGDYAVFSGEGASPAETVVRIWQEIWTLEAAGLPRAYITDFEVYQPNADVEVRVGMLVGS
ncbi:MAG TPA: GyrI-like domain-containing protein [Bryobacteraceae bacterium]|nr:GyrI-like domain-containing protein [Bryobacteraceae bacterium]